MTLFGWLLIAAVTWCPTHSYSRYVEYTRVAWAIVSITEDADDASDLMSIASFESRFDTHAVGALKECGAWQLRFFRCGDVEAEAREALRRWHANPCSYTGEAADAHSTCPMAVRRANRAKNWREEHPWRETGGES